MAISYTWTLNPLQCYPTSSQGSDYVFLVHWKYTATEEVSGSLYSAQVIGTQPLTSSSETFIPFEQLTEPVVQEWVENEMGMEAVNAMKATLAQNIVNQITPTTVALQSPWIK